MTEEEFMRKAIAVCRRGIEAGQAPFGSILIDTDGRVVAEAHNTVWSDCDPNAHAEVNVIRRAAGSLGRIALRGCTLYSTCEPCPMCLAACHWAKLDRVVFGAAISDAAAAGFSEMPIPADRMVTLGQSPLIVRGGPLREECSQLFQEWKETGNAKAY